MLADERLLSCRRALVLVDENITSEPTMDAREFTRALQLARKPGIRDNPISSRMLMLLLLLLLLCTTHIFLSHFNELQCLPPLSISYLISHIHIYVLATGSTLLFISFILFLFLECMSQIGNRSSASVQVKSNTKFPFRSL